MITVLSSKVPRAHRGGLKLSLRQLRIRKKLPLQPCHGTLLSGDNGIINGKFWRLQSSCLVQQLMPARATEPISYFSPL